MHARVSTYQAGDPQGLIDGFRSVTAELEQVEGFSHAYFMVDPGTGKAMSVTIWDSADALNASASKGDELRTKGTAPSGTNVQSVVNYEIPLVVGTMTRV